MTWRGSCWWLLLQIALAGCESRSPSLLLLDQAQLVDVSALKHAAITATSEHRRSARETLGKGDAAYQTERYAAASKLYMESACVYPTPQALLGLARSYARDQRHRESPAAEKEARLRAVTVARDWLNAAQSLADNDLTVLRMIADERAFQEDLARKETRDSGP